MPSIVNPENRISIFVPEDLHGEMVKRNITPFSAEFYALNEEFNARALSLKDNLPKLNDQEWSEEE